MTAEFLLSKKLYQEKKEKKITRRNNGGTFVGHNYC